MCQTGHNRITSRNKAPAIRFDRKCNEKKKHDVNDNEDVKLNCFERKRRQKWTEKQKQKKKQEI